MTGVSAKFRAARRLGQEASRVSLRRRFATERKVRRLALIALVASLRPGERLCRDYDYDCAGARCGCPPTHRWHTFLPVMPVGRHRDYDRCLRCGVAWTAREYAWQPATLVTLEAA